MADWLKAIGVGTIVMESTGVYWVPVFEVLEDAGLAVMVANARETRSVPGRKSDVNDAQWLQRATCLRLITCQLSPWPGYCRITCLSSAQGALVGLCRRPHSTYAKGINLYEFAIASCCARYHWRYRHENYSRYSHG
ncbi:MAG: transposase [Methylococcaceae bacterium]